LNGCGPARIRTNGTIAMTLYVRDRYEGLTDQAVFDFLQDNSLALLMSCHQDGPYLSHLPILIDGVPGAIGPLRGHLARENPHYQVLLREPRCTLVFSGPNAYLSPKWYHPPFAEAGSAPPTPRFPTWNYVVVHIKGRLRFAETIEETDRILNDTIVHFERRNGTNWDLSTYPAERRTMMRSNIAAFEVTPLEIVPKFKLNQYQEPEEILGGILGLYSQNDQPARIIARYMHEALRRRSRADE